MLEIWKPIKNYENLYEVSTLGNIKSLPKQYINNKGYLCTTKEKLLKPQIRNGYLFVTLGKNKNYKSFNIHRLVAEAFLKQKNKNQIYVNHKDLNKKNNYVNNLEWCTPSYNNKHYIKFSNKCKKVKCNEINITFNCARDAEKYYYNKYNKKINISRSCKSTYLKAGLFKWFYVQ